MPGDGLVRARRRLGGVKPFQGTNPVVLSDARSLIPTNMGDRETPQPGSCESSWLRPCLMKSVRAPRAPKSAQGVRDQSSSEPIAGEKLVRTVQPAPWWGAPELVTAGTGLKAEFGDRVKRAAVKSSTMKGPRGLHGKNKWRRSQTAKNHCRGVGGCFCIRPPEIEDSCLRKLWPGGTLAHTAHGPWANTH